MKWHAPFMSSLNVEFTYQSWGQCQSTSNRHNKGYRYKARSLGVSFIKVSDDYADMPSASIRKIRLSVIFPITSFGCNYCYYWKGNRSIRLIIHGKYPRQVFEHRNRRVFWFQIPRWWSFVKEMMLQLLYHARGAHLCKAKCKTK